MRTIADLQLAVDISQMRFNGRFEHDELIGDLLIGCTRSDEAQYIELTFSLRGRINFSESLRQRSFEQGEAHCHFQQFSANEPCNRIIRSTLAKLIRAVNG